MTVRQELARLSKNTLIYGGGDVLVRFINFLLLPVFTTYLSRAEYGLSSILGILLFLFSSLFSLGFSAATGPCYFEGNLRERKEAAIWTSFTILAVTAGIVVMAGTCFSCQISLLAFQVDQYGYLVTLTLLTTGFTILADPLSLYLRFEEKAKTVVALSVTSALTTTGLSVLLVVVLRRGIQGLVEAGLAARVITFVLFLVPVAADLRFRFSWRMGKELLRLGLPLIPSFIFVFLLQHGNKYVLQWYRGLDELGVYQVGFNLGMIIGVVVSAFQSAWYPFFMSFMTRQDEARLLVGRVLTYFVLSVGGLAVLFFVWSRPLVMLMTQPAFEEAHWVVGWSALSQCFSGVFLILLPGMYFAKEVKYVAWIQAGAAVVSMGLAILTIPSFGLRGAALLLALGHLLTAGFQWAWNGWHRKTYLAVDYEWSRLLWLTAVAIPFVALSLWDRHLSFLGEFAVSVSLCVALTGLLFFWLNERERRTLAGALRKLSPTAPGVL